MTFLALVVCMLGKKEILATDGISQKKMKKKSIIKKLPDRFMSKTDRELLLCCLTDTSQGLYIRGFR